MVYGSMRYDDPKNLDFDITVATQTHSPVLDECVYGSNDWTLRLSELWESHMNDNDGHISYVHFDTIEQAARDFELLDIDELGGNAFRLEEKLSDPSTVLTGYPIFAADAREPHQRLFSPLVKAMQEKAYALCMQYSPIAVHTAAALEDCLKIRWERRSIPKPSTQ